MIEEEPHLDQTSWYKNLSIIRWIFVIFGILIMLFAGGCSLLLLSDLVAGRGGQYIGVEAVAVFGGIPFVVGILIWWLAAKAGRQRKNQ